MTSLSEILSVVTAPIEAISKSLDSKLGKPQSYARHLDIITSRPSKFYVNNTSTPGVNLTWTVNNQQGSVNWIITNNTNQTVSVGLYRGVPNYSPIYFFGEAFPMVYLANNLVSPCTSIQQEFCLGIYSFAGFMKFPAFVFNIPPQSSYTITEYGFPPNPQIIATLVPLRPLRLTNAVVYYDPNLPQAYMQETGQQVPYDPDPFSMTSLVYEMPHNYPNIFDYLVTLDTPLTRSPFVYSIYLSLLNSKIGSLILSKI
mgnify:CR=1 FL=1